MALTATLSKVSDPNNKLTKTATGGQVFSVNLKDETSVIDPVLIVNTSTNISGYNYLYIAEFSRYYFVKNIKSIRNNLWEIEAHVDVLMSHQTQIKTISGIVERSTTLYNTYMNDSIPLKARPLVTTRAFPTSFRKNDASIVLIVAGKAS